MWKYTDKENLQLNTPVSVKLKKKCIICNRYSYNVAASVTRKQCQDLNKRIFLKYSNGKISFEEKAGIVDTHERNGADKRVSSDVQTQDKRYNERGHTDESIDNTGI